MLNYLIRRIFYAIPVLLGVNILTFLLFFTVNSPDQIARMQLGSKYVSSQEIQLWKQAHGYDLPLWYNDHAHRTEHVTQTLFFQKSLKLFTFNFGQSDAGRNISADISKRMWPSLAIAVPTLLIGLAVQITLALILILFRASYLEWMGVVGCVILMSISGLFYIIAGQYFFAKILQLLPISGYQSGWSAIKFVILPVFVGVASGIGASVRWYRTIFLEEMNKDYVRTAKAKGLSDFRVLFKHVLGNAMIPILTGIVVVIPLLFMGSLILESFFGIPGLGSYTIDAIQSQDFAVVRAMVFLGTVLYIIGLILTDLAYAVVDPRVRLQ